MDENQLRAAVDLGIRAERTRRFITETPYLFQLVERIRLHLLNEITKLHPLDTAKFTILQSQIDILPQIFAYMDADILAGEHASARIEDNTLDQKGSLL